MGTWSRDHKMHHWKKVLAKSAVNLNAGSGCDKLDFCLLTLLIQAHSFSSLNRFLSFTWTETTSREGVNINGKWKLFLVKFWSLDIPQFSLSQHICSILLGHLANNFNFLLRSEFLKVMYWCTVNESANKLHENVICKSFQDITVTQTLCQLA